MRWIMAIVVGAALAIALPIGAPDAQAKKNKCTASALDGKKVSWKCKRGEKCCFDTIMSTGTCVDKSAICL